MVTRCPASVAPRIARPLAMHSTASQAVRAATVLAVVVATTTAHAQSPTPQDPTAPLLREIVVPVTSLIPDSTERTRQWLPIELDGDNAAEALRLGDDGTLSIWEWTQFGMRPLEVSPQVFPTVIEVLAVAIGDVDGDNDDDAIAVLNSSPPIARVLRNDGNGRLALGAVIDMAGQISRTAPEAIALLDYDDDGAADLFVGSRPQGFAPDGPPQLYANLSGDGTLWPSTPVDLPLASTQLRTIEILTADVDGDGREDLVLRNPVLAVNPATAPEGQLDVLLNPAPGQLVGETAVVGGPAPGTPIYACSAGNFDGVPGAELAVVSQLVTQSGTTGGVSVGILTRASGVWQTQTSRPLSPAPKLYEAGILPLDWDRDGDTDLLITSGDRPSPTAPSDWFAHGNQLLLQNDGPVFSRPQVLPDDFCSTCSNRSCNPCARRCRR